MLHTLPPLPYAYDALEPYIDAQTMKIHHSKHHSAYQQKFIAALGNYPDLQIKPVEEILANLEAVPEEIRTVVRNNGGGYYHHSIFWTMMIKDSGGKPLGQVAQAIQRGRRDC